MLPLKSLLVVLIGIAFIASLGKAPIVSGKCELVVVSNQGQRIELHQPDYILTENEVGCRLQIINAAILKEITEFDSPNIFFCYKGKSLLAKGNDLFYSGVPAGATAFYPVLKNKKICLFLPNKAAVAASVIDIKIINKIVGH